MKKHSQVQKQEGKTKQSQFDKHIKEKQQIQYKKERRLKKENAMLSQEFKSQNKKSIFKDERKKNKGLDLPMPTKKVKKNLFDLDSQEDIDVQNMGQAFGMKDDFEHDLGSSHSSDYEQTYASKQNHAEGHTEEDKKKSQKDIYEEIIKKSKKFKHERQKLKEEAIETQAKLDEDFGAISFMLAKRARGQKDKQNEEDAYQKLMLDIEGDQRLKANLKEKKKKKVNFQEDKEQSEEDKEDMNGFAQGLGQFRQKGSDSESIGAEDSEEEEDSENEEDFDSDNQEDFNSENEEEEDFDSENEEEEFESEEQE